MYLSKQALHTTKLLQFERFNRLGNIVHKSRLSYLNLKLFYSKCRIAKTLTRERAGVRLCERWWHGFANQEEAWTQIQTNIRVGSKPSRDLSKVVGSTLVLYGKVSISVTYADHWSSDLGKTFSSLLSAFYLCHLPDAVTSCHQLNARIRAYIPR